MKHIISVKKLFLFIISMSAAYSMEEQSKLQSRFSVLTRQKTHAQFYPDVTTETEDKQQQAARCFKVLLGSEFNTRTISTEPRITFSDAKRYCDWASMYKNVPQAKEWFPADPEIIKRYINKIMFTAFYTFPSGSTYFGPEPGKEQAAFNVACEKLWKDKEALDDVLGQETKDFTEIDNRFNYIIALVRNFKLNPPQRNKLE